jgi:DNA adenine methylase
MKKGMFARPEATDSQVPVEKPRPFIKWVGGKRSIMPTLLMRLPRAGAYKTYNELFIGGGALFWEVLPPKGIIADTNPLLIATYRAIKEDVQGVISLLKKHRRLHDKEHYLRVRERLLESRSDTEIAADFIYLNKTCFNGLFRVNSKGMFNVPMGKYEAPAILDEPNLLLCSKALQGVRILNADFSKTRPQKGAFYYLDPPYHQTFSGYSKTGFTEQRHQELANFCKEVSRLGGLFMLSNSDTPFIREIFKGFQFEVVSAARYISCKPDQRGRTGELLIRNYE